MALLLLGGCMNPSWRRSSTFALHGGSGPSLVSPDSVEAGKIFVVETPVTGSSSCIRADGVELTMRGDTAEIVAYFQHRGGDCTADMHRTVQRVTVRFDRPGVAVLRRRGPNQMYERRIVVHPPRSGPAIP